MLIATRAPTRISFAGGGTDIEPYVSEEGGCVLAVAIKRYAFAYNSAYLTKGISQTAIQETIARHFHRSEGISVLSDIPPMSGLGGSASCFVAGIKAVKPELGKKEIAELAFHLERNVLGIAGGKQDQYMAAYGGLNYIEFGKDVSVERIKIPEGLEESLLLVYMGKRQFEGEDIIKDQMKKVNREAFTTQKEIARDMKKALKNGWHLEFGRLLDNAWQSKLDFSPLIANEEIQSFCNYCKLWGAIGGKLTGAGGGGYMLLMEDPDRKGRLRGEFKERNIKYENIEFDTKGVICLKRK